MSEPIRKRAGWNYYGAKRSWLRLNTATGLRPIKRHGWLARYARAAVEEAVSIESIHARNYGGHRHGGSGNPLLTELPLPSGWRNTCAH